MKTKTKIDEKLTISFAKPSIVYFVHSSVTKTGTGHGLQRHFECEAPYFLNLNAYFVCNFKLHQNDHPPK